MANRSYHDHLRNVTLFRDLDDHDIEVIAGAVTDLAFSEGDVLMQAGSSSREMVIVTEGELSVQKDGEEIAVIGKDGFAGEMGLLNDRPRNATVAAKTDVKVLHIDSRSFGNVLDEAPQIAVKMLPIVAGRVVDNNERHTD